MFSCWLVKLKKKKSVDSLLPLYGGLIMLKNKAGLKKKLVSAI